MEERARSAETPRPRPLPDQDADDDLLVLARLLNEEEAAEGVRAVPEPEPERGSPDAEPFLVAGRFEIEERLGAGPHGEVFRARDHENQRREIALKILARAPADEAGDQDLAASASELVARGRMLPADHLNRWRAAGRTEDGRVWLASDLTGPETARSLVQRAGALPPRHAFEVAHQLVSCLERLHAAGLAHGSVVATNVLFEKRVPWSEENPFAVGVRLTDTGLGELVHADFRADVEEDLHGAALVLVELLTGIADASDWAGSEMTAATACLSPAARATLDTALAADPAERFGDASSFRQALERAPEWRPHEVGRLVRALVFALGLLLAAGAGAFFVGGDDGVRADEARHAPDTVTPDASPERTDSGDRVEARATGTDAAEPLAIEGARIDPLAAEQALAERLRAERELDEQREAERTREAQRAAERALAAREAESARAARLAAEEELRKRREAEEELAAQLAAEEERAAGEAAALEEQRRAWEAERERLVGQLAEAQNELERTRAAGPTEAELASRRVGGRVDAFLTQLALRDLEGARTELFAFETDASAPPGADVLRALLEGAEVLLAQANANDLVRRRIGARALRDVSERAREARRLLGAPPFLDEPSSEPGLDCGARLADAIDALDASAASEEQRLEFDLERTWEDLLDAPDRPPSEVRRVAGWLGVERLDHFVAAYAGALRACDDGGSLDVNALLDFEHLSAWSRELADDPSADAGEVRLFAFAAALFDRDVPLPPVPTSTAPPGGWREDVLLRGQLLAGFTTGKGCELLVHARTADGGESWRRDVLSAGDGSGCELRQEFRDSQGRLSSERVLRIAVEGRAVYDEGVLRALRLDLGDPRTRLTAVDWIPPDDLDPPESLEVHPLALKRFRKRLDESPERGLLLVREGIESIWVPGYGLVRHVDPQRITTEVVFAEIAE